MPNNWKTYNLDDLCLNITDGAHSSPKEDINGTKLIGTVKDMTDHGFNLNQCKRISEYDFQKLESSGCVPDKGDILFSKDGTIGKVLHYKSNYRIGLLSSIAIFRPNKELIDSSFLAHYLSDSGINNFISANFRSGSAIPRIILRDFKKFELTIPPLPEQKAIANILSAIDDKIENNLAINKTLEDMAMALYKHWFVDFGPFQDGGFIDSELGPIPKGWEVKRLEEVAYKNSKTFNFNGKKKVVFVNTGDVQNGSFLHANYSEIEGLPGQAKKVIEPNDILYSEIRPKNKRYAFVDFDSSDYVVSTKFMIIRNNEKINNRLLYRILTRQETIDEFQMVAESRSGTFPQITFDAIGYFPLVLPNLEGQNKFQSIVEPFEQHQANNLLENQNLLQLRDTLLPKLISGDVRLKEFQEQIESVL